MQVDRNCKHYTMDLICLVLVNMLDEKIKGSKIEVQILYGRLSINCATQSIKSCTIHVLCANLQIVVQSIQFIDCANSLKEQNIAWFLLRQSYGTAHFIIINILV